MSQQMLHNQNQSYLLLLHCLFCLSFWFCFFSFPLVPLVFVLLVTASLADQWLPLFKNVVSTTHAQGMWVCWHMCCCIWLFIDNKFVCAIDRFAVQLLLCSCFSAIVAVPSSVVLELCWNFICIVCLIVVFVWFMSYVHCVRCPVLYWSCCSDLEWLLWPCAVGWVEVSKD